VAHFFRREGDPRKMKSLGVAAFMALSAIAVPAPAASASRSGAHDFDWEIGTWATKVRIRANPLSGGTPTWVDYSGTSVVIPLLDGRANFVELSVTGAKGKIEGGSLRLYGSQSEQWSLNYANLGNGLLTSPVYGGFDAAGHGMFYGADVLDGRAILVRFVITKVSPNEVRFEQAYSANGGVIWEQNWIAVDTRLSNIRK
jgi:hypothetical protein